MPISIIKKTQNSLSLSHSLRSSMSHHPSSEPDRRMTNESTFLKTRLTLLMGIDPTFYEMECRGDADKPLTSHNPTTHSPARHISTK